MSRFLATIIFSVVILFFPISKASSLECPSVSEAEVLLNLTFKFPFVVRSVRPMEVFNSCEIETSSGERFWLSADKKLIIEGAIFKVPDLRFSSADLKVFKKFALFSFGNGREVFLFTNPLCDACRKNRRFLKEISKRFRVYVIPVGFDGREFKAAVSAYCLKLGKGNFFTLTEFKMCDSGKLKVWSVVDRLKRLGITGIPAAVLDNGTVLVGIENIKRNLLKLN